MTLFLVVSAVTWLALLVFVFVGTAIYDRRTGRKDDHHE